MKNSTKNIKIGIAISHWIFYGAFMFGIFIDAEAWFFGFKLSGVSAQATVLGIGISGLIIGYFIFIQKKKAYFGAIALTILMGANLAFNYLTAPKLP